MNQLSASAGPYMPGDQSQSLLETISQWQNTTTIILHGGSVFEFKGVFPKGALAHGFYNLKNKSGIAGQNGFEGHLNLEKVNAIRFQSKLHRGQESHAFVFEDKAGECIFKIFLGRDPQGQLYPSQIAHFLTLREQYLTTY